MTHSLKKDFSSAHQNHHGFREKEVALPLSFRVTPTEKAHLKSLAGNLRLSTYIRGRLLEVAEVPRKKVHTPKHDQKLLGAILGALGQTRIASNLNQIAKAANMGALPVTEDVEADLHEACDYIRQIRSDLINALNIKVQE